MDEHSWGWLICFPSPLFAFDVRPVLVSTQLGAAYLFPFPSVVCADGMKEKKLFN